MRRFKLAIIGAGGHTRSLLNIIDREEHEIIGIFEDSYDSKNIEVINEVKVAGTIQEIPKNTKKILSIGDNEQRKRIFNQNINSVYKENLISNSAIIKPYVLLGESNQIFDNAYIDSCVKVGDNNILNIGCTISHQAVIGNHNHISIGAGLMGGVSIGDCCFIGAGTVVIDKIKITDNVIIGAGSVVINDILDPGTYVGNPARKIK